MAFLALTHLLACSEVPLDSGAEPVQNVIAGEVVYLGDALPAQTFLFLTDASNPPPPRGTGGPTDFLGLPASAYTQTAAEARINSASFTFPEVPSGSWVLTGLSDTDHNFYPQDPSTAGATCGDVVGGYIASLDDTTLVSIDVTGGSYVKNRPVLLATALTTNRPVFELVTRTTGTTGGTVSLKSARITNPLVTINGPFDPTAPDLCDSFFPLYLQDYDLDGSADPHPTYGEPFIDAWPKFYLSFEAEDGTRYAAEAPLAIDPTGLPTNTLLPLTELSIQVLPLSLKISPDGTQTTTQSLPPGIWTVTAISPTGQTWTLPNGAPAFGSLDPTWDPSPQGIGLTIKSQ